MINVTIASHCLVGTLADAKIRAAYSFLIDHDVSNFPKPRNRVLCCVPKLDPFGSHEPHASRQANVSRHIVEETGLVISLNSRFTGFTGQSLPAPFARAKMVFGGLPMSLYRMNNGEMQEAT
jgi:hypothetical protein